MRKGNIQFILIFLHRSAAERTWLLGQSQACQRSGASGPWLPRISSYNPAVPRENQTERVHWKLGTLHTTYRGQFSFGLWEEPRKCIYTRSGLSSGSGTFCSLQLFHCRVEKGIWRWRKGYGGGERNMKVEKGTWRTEMMSWLWRRGELSDPSYWNGSPITENTGQLPIKLLLCLHEHHSREFLG